MISLQTYKPDPILLKIKKESSIGSRLQALYAMRWTKMGRDLAKIISTSSYQLNWQAAKPLILRALVDKTFSWRKAQIRKILSKLPSGELHDLLQSFHEVNFNHNFATPVSRLLSLLTDDEMLHAVKTVNKDMGWDTLKSQIETLQKPPLILGQNRHSSKKLKTPLQKVFQLAVRFLDTILMAFSFFSVGREPGSSWEASYMLDIYAKFFALPFIIATLLNSLLAIPILSALIAVAIVVAIVALASLYVKNRPCCDTIPSCTNKNRQAEKKELSPVFIRKDEIEKLINLLTASTLGVRIHPILVGPPGAGKTELINCLAQRIVQGDVPAILKNKKIFWINTAELINDPFSYDATHNKVQRIVQRIGKHKNDVILVLDDIEAAFHEQSRLWQRLKGVLDSLPFCIAIAATKEYENFFSSDKGDKAFASRFVKVEVKPTSENQTLVILRQLLSREAPELIIPDEILTKIANIELKITGRENPGGPTRVLMQLIAMLRQSLATSPSVQDKDLKQKQENAEQLYVKYFQSLGTPQEADAMKEYVKAKSQASYTSSQAAISIEAMQKISFGIKHANSEIANMTEKTWPSSSMEQSALRKQWLYYKHYSLPALKNKMPDIKKLSADLLKGVMA